MPGISKERMAQGGRTPSGVSVDEDRDWSIPTDARTLMARPTPLPDQGRYGTATSDPLGREGPGWHIGPSGLPVKDKEASG